MAALVCDICGGKLVMGSGGIAVCDSCGMEHSPDRVKEKVQEIKGTVQVDNSHMIDNWMKMGKAASEAGNYEEAYDYFTKVVEIDSQNWRAIFEKGKSGAWQSTLGNLRTSEIYQGITMAMEIINASDMPNDEVIGIKNEFAVALFNINNAITDLMEQNLFDLSDKYFDAHFEQMWETRQRHITNVSQLEDALTLIADLEDDLSKRNIIEFKKRMCNDLRDACASTQYWTDYSESSLAYLGFEHNEKKQYISKYWSLVDEIRMVEPTFATEKWTYPDPFGPGLNSTDEIYNYWKKIELDKKAQREKEAAKKRFEEYWQVHSEERKQFESRLSEIDDEIRKNQEQKSAYDSRIEELERGKKNKVSADDELKSINNKISDLYSQKKELSLFQSKQKKAFQEQIDKLTVEAEKTQQTVKLQRDELVKDIDSKISSIKIEMKPYADKLIGLEKEKKHITNELKRPR